MTDKRVEAIAKIFADACAGDKNLWVGYVIEAQAAISADPVTEDVKRLVEALEEIAYSPNTITEADCAIVAKAALKKWSGE